MDKRLPNEQQGSGRLQAIERWRLARNENIGMAMPAKTDYSSMNLLLFQGSLAGNLAGIFLDPHTRKRP